MRPISLTRGDALLVVGVQNDFLPGGALAVPEGDAVIAPVNMLVRLYVDHGLPVYAARDWHPPEHGSFASQGGRWPSHCVAHTHGAAFPETLALPADAVVVSMAGTRGADDYSAFRGTTLAEQLGAHGVERLAACGLATEQGVLGTVSDALALGFRALLVLDAIRAAEPGDAERAVALMIERGALPVKTRPPSLLDEAALLDTTATSEPGRLLK